MIDFTLKSQYGFYDLVDLVRALRAPGGCPWDQVQTHQSIRRNFVEEAWEACEAIDEADPAHMREELGDVLLQVVFHTGIETDAGGFGIDDVCDTVCKKMITRHPNLFTDGMDRPDWESLKQAQRGNRTVTQAMEGISKALPALWRADKILSKAESSGLFRRDPEAAVEALTHALAALTQPDASDPEAALGAALFALTALAGAKGLDPETALIRHCNYFIAGFAKAEAAAAEAAAASKDETKQKKEV